MKKPSDQLFRLIQAMTPAEKRYFKMRFASEKTNLTELFDFINQMSNYDEEALKQHFHGSIRKNLKVYKIQLQDILLKSLTAYRSKKSVRSQIRIGLEEVDLLMEKRLHELAAQKLEKVKKLAMKYEEFTYLVEIGYQELILLYIRIEKVGMSRHPLFREIQQYIRRLQVQYDLTLLGNQLNDKRRQIGPSQLSEGEREALRDQLTTYPLNEDPEKLNFHSRILNYAGKSFIYSLLGEQEEEFHYRYLSLDQFTQFSHFQKSMSFNYLGVLRNYIGACLKEKNYEAVVDAVKRAEAFVETEGQMQPQLSFFHEAELEARFEQGKFREITGNLEPKIRRHLKRYRIGQERIAMVMYIYLALTYQILGNNQQVQAYIRLLRDVEEDLFDYFSEMIYSLELINHFEAKDFTSLGRTLKSLSRQKNKVVAGSSLFRALVDCFRQLHREPFQQKTLARAFYQRIEDYESDFFYNLFVHFKLDHWLQAAARQQSFGEYIKMKLLG